LIYFRYFIVTIVKATKAILKLAIKNINTQISQAGVIPGRITKPSSITKSININEAVIVNHKNMKNGDDTSVELEMLENDDEKI